MNETVNGIVLRTTDYREKDKILNIFTDEGIVTAVAKGVRSPTAKLRPLATVLTYGEFNLMKKGGALTGGEVKDSFFACWSDMKKYSAAMICLELTEKCFGREDDTAGEFSVLLTLLRSIESDSAPMYFPLWYALFCAKRTGVDFSKIGEYDPDTFSLLSAVAADAPCMGVVGASERDFFSALRLLAVCFTDTLDIRLRTINEAEQLLRVWN